MTGDSIIAERRLNRRERMLVSIENFKGVYLINIRKWLLADDGDRPGRSGIALNVTHLPQLTDAVVKALAVATAQGLVRETPADDGPCNERPSHREGHTEKQPRNLGDSISSVSATAKRI
jgi:hypothetical protein